MSQLEVNKVIPQSSTTLTLGDSGDKVGIGTSSPDSPLTITNSGTGTANAIELENFSGESSYIKAKRGLTLSADYLNNSGGTQSNIIFETDGSEAMRIDSSANLKFNSGYGSVATAYGCRAWVNFNGEGTVAIRESGNVSSITDNGDGDYTVNFSSAMPDANYSSLVTAIQSQASSSTCSIGTRDDDFPRTTSAVRFLAQRSSGTDVDLAVLNVAIFR